MATLKPAAPAVGDMETEEIETLAVLGAGTMGHGIAEVAALAGYEVYLRDIEEDLVEEGYDQIAWSLEKLAENGAIGEDDREAALAGVTPVVDLETAVEDADVVIEAIVEDMDIKKQVYGELDDLAPERTIFASNTSSLSVTELSETTDRAEQFCGMHFFNPPVRMELVEVIRGGQTSDETLEAVEGLAEDLGKTPVRVRKDEPGFVVNRVLVPLMNEACWLVGEGEATVAEVDSTAKYGLNIPMGAFELGDQVGNDVILHVLRYMEEVLGEAYEPAPMLVEAVEDERLGRKTGEGFYDYEDGGVDVPPDEGRDDIEARLLAVMANEVGKLLQKEIAPVGEVDRAVKLGGGFPDGPARMADDAGLESLVGALEAAHEQTGGARYEVSAGLQEAVEAGGFYDDGGGGGAEAAAFETVRLEHPSDRVARIVLDRPHQLNTVTPEVLEEFEAALDRVEADDEVRALVVAGEGDRAFSAGADAAGMAGDADSAQAVELSRKGQEAWGRLEELAVPVVAAVDGFALGGGMELAACADVRVASERSTFGQPERDLGILPGWGGTQRLSPIIGEGRAREVVLTGDHYDPETMADYGFVNEVVPADDLMQTALDLAEDLAAGPPLAQEYIKRAFLAGRDDTEAGLEVEAQAFGHVVTSEDFLEGVSKMGSDEEPDFEGE
jgi:enoyl-CoA hydratase/3-hydroxyacyl-CoA dehydrogenase